MMYEWLDITAAVTTAAFVNGVWIGALLAVAAWGLIRIMAEWRPLNATTRFFVWMSVFVMSTGLVIWQGERFVDDTYSVATDVAESEWAAEIPATTWDVPEAPLKPILPPVAVQKPDLPEAPEAPPVLMRLETPEAIEMPATPKTSSLPAMSPEFEKEEALAPEISAVLEEEKAVIASSFLSEGSSLLLPERIEVPALSSFLRVVLFTIWGTIAGMLLLRVMLGWRGVWRLKRNSYTAPVRVQNLLKKLLGQIENPRPIEVAISDEVQTAVAIGFQKPRILLPASMLSTLSQGELEQVLLHEAAHLQRRDDWTMLFQRIVGALLFFHPGIILLGKLMDRDREFASDDWVIALTKRPKAYASCLAKLVTQYARTQPPIFVPGFSSGKEELFERVKTILDKKREISFKLSPATYLSVLIATVLLLVFTVQIAPVVALPQEAAELTEPLSSASALIPAAPPTVDIAPEVVDTPEVLAVEASATYESDALVASEELVLDTPELASLPVSVNENPQADNNNRTRPESDDSTNLEEVSALAYTAVYGSETDTRVLPQPVVSQLKPATAVSEVSKRTDSLSTRSFAHVLINASRIESSGDKTALLLEAVKKRKFEYLTTGAYLGTTSSVPSSGDKARLLIALTEHQQIDSLSAILYLREASRISSSSDKSRVLISSLNSNSLPLHLELTRSEYIRAIESISSSSDYRKVMKVFLEKTKRVKG